MLSNDLKKAIKRANYEILAEDSSIYAEIPDCKGVYANAKTFEECRNILIEVLDKWIFIRLRRNFWLFLKMDTRNKKKH